MHASTTGTAPTAARGDHEGLVEAGALARLGDARRVGDAVVEAERVAVVDRPCG